MIPTADNFVALKKNISKEKRILSEIVSINKELEKSSALEKNMINAQISSLKSSLKKVNNEVKEILEKINLTKRLKEAEKVHVAKTEKNLPLLTKSQIKEKKEYEKEIIKDLEKQTLKRLRKKGKKIKKKRERKASYYTRLSNKFFRNTSTSLLKKGYFKNLKRNLIKANMQYLAKSYLSVVFFTTFLSMIGSFFLFIFLLFFNFGVTFPFITPVSASIFSRLGSIFWILIVFPLGVFIFAYMYPSLEKKSIETRINQELPFATIHMSSISESLVEPSNIFRIIISTKEYPTLEKEFIKLLNEVNVFGYDLVSALRNSAFNSPSRRLAELFDGLATTITSGGDLSDFFEKRAQTLLFDYKLEKEKKTKSAETFMDIYISVVIAAPMILMLLLIMMRVSGLGLALSTSMISLIMVLGVSTINVIFLVFLHLRQGKE